MDGGEFSTRHSQPNIHPSTVLPPFMLRYVLVTSRKFYYSLLFIGVTCGLITSLQTVNSDTVSTKWSLATVYAITTTLRNATKTSTAGSNPSIAPRVLVFSSDNRPLDDANSSAFVRTSMVINYHYASIHGYDYRYFSVKYKPLQSNKYKDAPSCYNAALNQERAGPWSKLQVLWHALTSLHTEYDWFLYLDSDVIIVNHSMSLPSYARHVRYFILKDRGCHFFLHANCSIAFMDNKPFTWHLPNSGMILFRKERISARPADTLAARLFQLWWHHNRSEKNFAHDYEQSPLWNLVYQYDFFKKISLNGTNKNLYDLSKRLQLNRRIAIINDFSFDFRNGTQFIEHIGSSRPRRLGDMYRSLDRLSINGTQARSLYDTIQAKYIVRLNTSWDRIPAV